MPNDTYLNLCTQVYDLSKPTPPQDAYDFYRAYIAAVNGPILEPMCGTGRFLLPLLAEGFDVHGFDSSAHMLDALRQKATTQNLKPIVWQGLLQDLKTPDRYVLMFIPAGSFGLITQPQDIQHSLEVLYAHLQDQGILLFEIETTYAVSKPIGVWHGVSWPLPNGQKIVASYCPTISSDLCSVIGRYELVADHHILQTEIEEYHIKLYDSTINLTKVLNQIGFKSIRFIKAFDKNRQLGKTDAVLVCECIK